MIDRRDDRQPHNWRRYLKRRNCSPNTVKNYLNTIKAFVIWLDVPVESVTHTKVSQYIDHLMRKRLMPKTINCQLELSSGNSTTTCGDVDGDRHQVRQ